jgi:hypothetical protein
MTMGTALLLGWFVLLVMVGVLIILVVRHNR